MAEGVMGAINRFLGREKQSPKELVLGNNGSFSIKPGDVVYIGRDPEASDLWNTSLGKKRQIIIKDPKINSGYLSGCAIRLTISPEGHIIADKETGREGESLHNQVYAWVWDETSSEWVTEKIVGHYPPSKLSADQIPNTPPDFDIITNDHNVIRLKHFGGSTKNGQVVEHTYQVLINPTTQEEPKK